MNGIINKNLILEDDNEFGFGFVESIRVFGIFKWVINECSIYKGLSRVMVKYFRVSKIGNIY